MEGEPQLCFAALQGMQNSRDFRGFRDLPVLYGRED